MQTISVVSEQFEGSSSRLDHRVLRVAVGTLFLAASSWISIPTAPIPTTMQTYAVIVIGSLFGARLGSLSRYGDTSRNGTQRTLRRIQFT
jgi:biotin transport system substrate-specific component